LCDWHLEPDLVGLARLFQAEASAAIAEMVRLPRRNLVCFILGLTPAAIWKGLNATSENYRVALGWQEIFRLQFVPMTTAEINVSLWADNRGHLERVSTRHPRKTLSAEPCLPSQSAIGEQGVAGRLSADPCLPSQSAIGEQGVAGRRKRKVSAEPDLPSQSVMGGWVWQAQGGVC
jgi:hypothetical protein